MQSELVDKASTGPDWLLADSWTSVHVVGNFEAMPVHGSGFRQMVVHKDANAVSLIDLNRRTGSTAVETPKA